MIGESALKTMFTQRHDELLLRLSVEYATKEVSRPNFVVVMDDKVRFHWKHPVSLTSSEIKRAKHCNFD